jgi:lysophospholipase L1-like esterase
VRARVLSRVGVAALCLAATAACSSASGSASSSSGSAEGPLTTSPLPAYVGSYLAIGDSLPFGTRIGEADEVYADAANFVGYPELVGQSRGLHVLNAACPGETTASATSGTAADGGCPYRQSYPLHVDYESASESQLAYAVRALQQEDDVELVTVQLGANDLVQCRLNTTDRCQSELGTTVGTAQSNVSAILARLRSDGGYAGPIVVVTYYEVDLTDDVAVAQIRALNSGLSAAAQANGAAVASGFDAFQPVAAASGGDSRDAGLVLPNDIHPSRQGQQLLADAVEAAVPG